MINFSKFKSLLSLTMYFRNDDICKKVLAQSRWSDGDVVCPYCGGHHCKTRKDGKYRCPNCGRNFSVLVGTIFQNTKVSLVQWFIAMYLISSHKKGISSHQLAKDINVTQATAWYMLQKIRTLFAQNNCEAFEGTIECDEVYIGGKEKWKHKSMRTPHTQGRSTKTKTPIFGMMERNSFINLDGEEESITYVHAFVVENTNRDTLQPIIQQFVTEGSRVITDELSAYNGLATLGYTHAVVAHGAEEYANGDVFTKSIEGGSYPMVPCCPCVSVRRNQGRLTKPLNEGTHLFLRQNAVESLYKVAHRSLAVASYHIIDSLDMTDVVSLCNSPNMGLI